MVIMSCKQRQNNSIFGVWMMAHLLYAEIRIIIEKVLIMFKINRYIKISAQIIISYNN